MYDINKVIFNFGDHLQYILDEKGIPQIELCRMMNVDRTCVSKYCVSGTIPSLRTCLKMCNALGITIDELLGV